MSGKQTETGDPTEWLTCFFHGPFVVFFLVLFVFTIFFFAWHASFRNISKDGSLLMLPSSSPSVSGPVGALAHI